MSLKIDKGVLKRKERKRTGSMSLWNQGLTLQATPEKVTPGCSFPGGGAAAGRGDAAALQPSFIHSLLPLFIKG